MPKAGIRPIAVGDFNDDGLKDIAAATDFEPSVLINDTPSHQRAHRDHK